MELQGLEVQICAKTETRGLKMAFLVEILPAIVSAIFNCFRASQMEFEHVFDNLTFKHMDALSRGGSRP